MSAPARSWCLAAGLLIGALQALAAPVPAGYSAAGLYNLANSYARAGKTGDGGIELRARKIAFARTILMSRANLRFVRSSAHLPAETRSTFDRVAGAASPGCFWRGSAIAGLIIVGCRACWQGRSSAAPIGAFAMLGILLGVVCMVGLTIWQMALRCGPKMHAGVVDCGGDSRSRISGPHGPKRYLHLAEGPKPSSSPLSTRDFTLIRDPKWPLRVGIQGPMLRLSFP